MNKLLLGSIAGAISLVATLPVFADSVTTSTETIQEAPRVIDSYMKPTVTQTKTFQADDGTVHSVTAPMVLERHEQVVLPTAEVRTTTTTTDPRVVTQEVSRSATHVASRPRHIVSHKCVAVRHKVRHVAVRHRPRSVAYNVKRTTIVEPGSVEQTQTVRESGVVIERKDPALDQF